MSHVNKQGVIVKSFLSVDHFLVYPVTHNLVDLFWGRGFTNHARFKFQRDTGWAVWNKSTSLPRGYQEALGTYKESAK